jgi:molybdate/tungstate transport system permease protein
LRSERGGGPSIDRPDDMTETATTSRGRSLPWFQLLAAVLGSCVLLFILAPLVGLVVTCSLSELSEAAADAEVQESIRLTLLAALAATAACTLAGIPLGYVLARRRFPGRSVVLAVIDLPIIIPHSAAGLALLTVIGRRSLVGSTAEGWGAHLVGSSAGIAMAMAFVSVPFLINAARAGFEAVPERLERVARTLGASPARVFFTIAVPLAWREILSGMILMWARGISEFGAVIIIAYHPMTAPVLVFQRFNDFGLASARSVAVLLIFISVAIFAVLRLLARRRGAAAADRRAGQGGGDA